MRVLIVDDDPGIRRGLCAQVQADGFDVVACGTGKEALERLTGTDVPPIAVIDWVLPDRSGVEVCRAVRRAAESVTPYIIMLTVRTGARDVSGALDAGANDYVTKPFSMMELRARIRVGCRVAELQDKLQHQAIRAEAALSEVRLLSGLLPICSRCRHVRDDDDYWRELKDYLSEHADAGFAHGICAGCAAKLDCDGTRVTGEDGKKQ